MGPDPKPTASSKRRAALQTPSDGLLLSAATSGLALEGAAARCADVLAAFTSLLTRDDGYLRVIPKEDGDTVYWKWKFSGGPYIHHYVMVVYPHFQCSDALLRLATKIHAVYRGEERPVRDKYLESEVR